MKQNCHTIASSQTLPTRPEMVARKACWEFLKQVRPTVCNHLLALGVLGYAWACCWALFATNPFGLHSPLCFDRMHDHRPILLLFLGDSLVSGVGAQAQQNFGKNKCDCGLEWVLQRLNYFSSMVQLTRSKCQQWAHFKKHRERRLLHPKHGGFP